MKFIKKVKRVQVRLHFGLQRGDVYSFSINLFHFSPCVVVDDSRYGRRECFLRLYFVELKPTAEEETKINPRSKCTPRLNCVVNRGTFWRTVNDIHH